MSDQFKALILDQKGEEFTREVKSIDISFLKHGDVTIKVDYSDLNFKDGKKHGEFITWNQKGNVYAIQNYKDGLRDGKSTVWHEDGRLLEWVFKDGEFIGTNSNAHCGD